MLCIIAKNIIAKNVKKNSKYFFCKKTLTSEKQCDIFVYSWITQCIGMHYKNRWLRVVTDKGCAQRAADSGIAEINISANGLKRANWKALA